MLLHRWETISHIISDTKLSWFTKTVDDDKMEDDIAEVEIESEFDKFSYCLAIF